MDAASAVASWRAPACGRRVAPLGIGSPPRRKRKRPADDADDDAPLARDGFATLRGDATTAVLAEQCADAIERLASQVSTVNAIYRDIASLVGAQQEDVDDIETLVQSSHDRTAKGQRQLERAVRRRAQNDPNHPGRIWLPFTIENDRVLGTPDPNQKWTAPDSDWAAESVLPTLTDKSVSYIEKQAKTDDPFFLRNNSVLILILLH